MSSLRNAIPQRTYRERAQPKSREKLGLLEKHKDYSARARDYNAKKKRLKILREKASNRNPDEFHFGMMSSRTKNGVKIADRGNKVLSQEVVKLMKTQDAGYLRTIRQRVRREIERYEESLRIEKDQSGNVEALGPRDTTGGHSHVKFVDDVEEQQHYGEEVENAAPEAQAFENEIPQKQQSKKLLDTVRKLEKEERLLDTKNKQSHQLRKAKLDALRAQEQELATAEQELDNQRSKMQHTVRGVNKKGVKFQVRERKR